MKFMEYNHNLSNATLFGHMTIWLCNCPQVAFTVCVLSSWEEPNSSEESFKPLFRTAHVKTAGEEAEE